MLLLLGGCQTPRAFRQPWFAQTPEGSLYRSHCGSCHGLRDPTAYPRVAWVKAMAKFGRRSHLAEPDQVRVQAWLEAHASDVPRPPEDDPVP